MTRKVSKNVSGKLGWAVVAALLLPALWASPASAAVPPRLTEQGRLFQAGTSTPVAGNVSMVFSIYAAATGGTALWTETFSVTLEDGYYSVQLGATVPFPATLWDGSVRYIGLKVAADPEMTPREEVASVPYALRADVSDRLGTLAPADVVTGVTGGPGLTATRTNNAVSLSLDATMIQQRVAGTCAAGSAIASVAANGTVTCQAVSMSTYSATTGGGLLLNGTGFGLTSCPAGQVLKSSGTGWACAADADTANTAGVGLTLTGTAFAIDSAVVARKDAAAGNQAFDTSTLYLDYANNRVGVNNAAPAAPLDVTGRVRATGYDFNAAQTGSIFISGVSFSADISSAGAQWNVNTGYGNFLSTSTAQSVSLGTSVNLPHGVTPTAFTCYVYDNDATNNVSGTANFYRLTLGATTLSSMGGVSLATATGAEATTPQAKTIAPAAGTVIDNNTYGYFIYMNFGTTPNLATGLRFYGCRISYSYTAVAF